MSKENQLSGKSKEELINLVLEQEKEISKLKENFASILEQFNLMRHQKFGSKSEKLPDEPDEVDVFDEAIEPDNKSEIEESDEEITIAAHTRKKKGRKPLPKNLPRIEKTYDLPEADKKCSCGFELSCIGDARSEQLEVIPAFMYITVHIRKKYACKDCEGNIKQALLPPQPIPKSIAGPGLLAHILVSKFEDHLPLYRQEKILNRIGVDIPRATLSNWVIKCSVLLRPLWDIGAKLVNDYDVAYSDETPIQVLKEPNRKAQNKSYMWIIGGGKQENFFILYKYSPSRAHEVPLGILKDFSGFLHSDGYGGYDALAKKIEIKQVGCWYHARRKFIEAQKVSKKSGFANYVVKKIALLAKIEKQQAILTPEEMCKLRQEKAKPILIELKTRLEEQQPKVPPESLLGKAISYTLNQWLKLMNYTLDGRLENNNNKMERCAKPFATGRKNWMFANSVSGANAAAIIYSLIETCKFHKISAYHWLAYVLKELPKTKNIADLEKLLPFNVKPEDLKITSPPKLTI